MNRCAGYNVHAATTEDAADMTEYRSNHAFISRSGRHRAETRLDRFIEWVRRCMLTEMRAR